MFDYTPSRPQPAVLGHVEVCVNAACGAKTGEPSVTVSIIIFNILVAEWGIDRPVVRFFLVSTRLVGIS